MSAGGQLNGGVGALPKDPRAKTAMARWDELKSDRGDFEADWEDIARLIRPQRGGFKSGDHSTRRMEKPLSSAPIIAQQNLASGLYGTLTNPANKWFGVKTGDDELNNSKEMGMWLDTVGKRLLASFRPSMSPFYDATIQLFSDVCAFGNSVQYDELIAEERKIMDQTLSLAEVVWDIDAWGRVVELVRKFKLTPKAAAKMFGLDNLPPKIQDLYNKSSKDKVWFYHHVLPNDDYRDKALGPRGKKFLSHYATEIECAIVRVRGYKNMPFHAPRWEVESGMTCGTGPGFVALASSRVLQRMDDATLRAAQHAADPTKLAPDRDTWALSGKMRPGGMIYGGVDARGNPLIRNMESTGNINLTLAEKEQKVSEIRDAFNWSLMNLAGRTGMTATEVMTIQEERQRLMAPHLGRIQHEFLRPKVERRFEMLWTAGQLPPPPPEAAGMELQIDYLSAAAMAQKSAEGTSVVRILQDLAPLAQIDPRAMDRINMDGAVEALHEARGAPSGILVSREEADKKAQARNAAQQEQMQLDQGTQAAAMAKDAAAAGVI